MNFTGRRFRAFFSVALSCIAVHVAPQTTGPAQPGLPDGAVVRRDVNYAGDSNPQHTLDLYLPADDGKPHPILMYVHGGAWEAGDKAIVPGQAQIPLLSRNCALATINYRLTQEAIYPAQRDDCKAAVRFLRANAKRFSLDPDRIGVWGDSAGGHLVALLGTSGDVKEMEGHVGKNLDASSKVRCVIDWYGPTDLGMILKQAGPHHPSNAHPEDSPLVHLFGGPPESKPDLVRLANPIAFVSAGDPPFLIQHGDKDPLVPLAQSQILVDALRKAGVPVEFEVIRGAGHGFGYRDNVLPAAQRFLEKYLFSAS